MTTYTHKKSLRHTTDEQFSEGTTVDGNRLDRAMAEITDHYNSIPAGDVLTRLVETKYVFGYRANREYLGSKANDGTYYYAHHWPWVPIANNRFTTGPGYSTSGAGTVEDWQNPYLVKGVALGEASVTNEGRVLPTITGAGWGYDWYTSLPAANTIGVRDNTDGSFGTPTGGPDNGYQYAWTIAYHFSKPVTIDDLMVNLVNGDDAAGATAARAPFSVGGAARGSWPVSVVIMVDDFVTREKRENASIELAAHKYDLSSLKWDPAGHSAGYTDMIPAHQDGLMQGRSWRWRDLNIPIPANSRVRLMVTLPWPKNGDKDFGLSPAGALVKRAPFHSFDPSGCLTVLEEVEE